MPFKRKRDRAILGPLHYPDFRACRGRSLAFTAQNSEEIPQGAFLKKTSQIPAEDPDAGVPPATGNREASAPNFGRVILTTLLACAILAGLVLAVIISWNRNYQVDEVENIHAAYNMRRGLTIYKDFWQGHNPLLYLLLEPLIQLKDPVASFILSRMEMLVFLLATIAFAVLAARRTHDGWAGILTGSMLLFHTTFIERGIEVRADGPAVLCVMAALYVELGRSPTLRRYCLQALLMSAAFLLTQKSVFFCFGFGSLWLVQAFRERRLTLVAVPMLCWLAPVALTAGWLAWTDCLDDFIRYSYTYPMQNIAGQTEDMNTFGPWGYLVWEGRRNVVFSLAAAVTPLGLALCLWKRPEMGRRLIFPFYLALLGLVSLYVNPFPFPYSQVAVLPMAALVVACLVQVGTASLGRPHLRYWSVPVFLGLCMVTSLPRLILKTAPSNRNQYEILREIDRIAKPDDAVFDLAGLYFRPDAYPVYLMTHAHATRYRGGFFPPMIPHFRQNGLVVYVRNYRSKLLGKMESQILARNFFPYKPNIYVSGKWMPNLVPGKAITFEVFKENPYRYEGPGTLLVDGVPFAKGLLPKGEHLLTAEEPIRGGLLRLDTPLPDPPLGAVDRPIFLKFD